LKREESGMLKIKGAAKALNGQKSNPQCYINDGKRHAKQTSFLKS
jgi:hypothetical protein